jgi:hypothetical protein
MASVLSHYHDNHYGKSTKKAESKTLKLHLEK